MMGREEHAELAADAVDLKNSSAFSVAFKQLHDQYVQELIAAPVGDLTSRTAHAKLKVLEDVKGSLESIITEAKFRARKNQ
jgi:uncharacterized protein (DUF2461 family)